MMPEYCGSGNGWTGTTTLPIEIRKSSTVLKAVLCDCADKIREAMMPPGTFLLRQFCRLACSVGPAGAHTAQPFGPVLSPGDTCINASDFSFYTNDPNMAMTKARRPSLLDVGPIHGRMAIMSFDDENPMPRRPNSANTFAVEALVSFCQSLALMIVRYAHALVTLGDAPVHMTFRFSCCAMMHLADTLVRHFCARPLTVEINLVFDHRCMTALNFAAFTRWGLKKAEAQSEDQGHYYFYDRHRLFYSLLFDVSDPAQGAVSSKIKKFTIC